MGVLVIFTSKLPIYGCLSYISALRSKSEQHLVPLRKTERAPLRDVVNIPLLEDLHKSLLASRFLLLPGGMAK